MANEQNLKKPWPKGTSGNPKGMPKGIEHSRTRMARLLALTQKMTNPVTGKLEDFTVMEQIDMILIQKARKGDQKAIHEILNRVEGLPVQAVVELPPGSNPVIFTNEVPAPQPNQGGQLPDDSTNSKPSAD